MSLDEKGWWSKTDYYALVMHHMFASHSEVYAVFSTKEAADVKCAEFEAQCKAEQMGMCAVEWSVEPIDMAPHLGFLGKGQKFEKIAVVNTIPSVARFAFYPSSTELVKFTVDECEPLVEFTTEDSADVD